MEEGEYQRGETLVNILKLKPEVLSRLVGNLERCK